MIRLVAIALLIASCGGTSSTSPPPPAPPPVAEHHDEPKMSPELAKFHDVLAPRWHAEKTPARMQDTCAAIPEFTAALLGIAKAGVPANTDATAWNDGAAELAHGVTDLDHVCQANDAAAFDATFAKVHQSFHRMMETEH